MIPSPLQLLCYEAAANTTDSLTIKSVAGSGKTSTLGEISYCLSGTGRSTSFSKSTVTELGPKMSSSFPARTMHGDGVDILKAAWGSYTVDKGKFPQKVFDFVSNQVVKANQNWLLKTPICELVDQAQTAGIVPGHDRFLLADTADNWEMLADQYDIQFSAFILSTARKALSHSTELAFKDHIISFNDMLYIPLFFPMRIRQHKTIIVDEAQDLSPIQHALLRKQLRKNGRIIAAGDEHQAIYGFRGAMTNSYEALASEFAARHLHLNVSYRCPQTVVAEAKQYVPEIESAPGAPLGNVIQHDNLELTAIPKTVLCRNNAPLISLALRLFVAGHTVEVAGRDIGTGLKSLTKRIASGKNSAHMKAEDFYSRAEKWADREIGRKPKSKPRVRDKMAAFKALCNHHRTLGDIRQHIDSLYVNPSDKRRRPAEFHLSTIHRAKGREWPEILFLDPHLIPAKWAEQDWEKQQESNLAYVGITRAQKILHYCASGNIY